MSSSILTTSHRPETVRSGLLTVVAFVMSLGPAMAEDPTATTCADKSERPIARTEVFGRGYEAYEINEFADAADWMGCADEHWTEEDYQDEEVEVRFVRVNRYVVRPYLPRYYQGEALLEAGCYASAFEKYEDTVLKDPRSSASQRLPKLRRSRNSRRKACCTHIQRGEFHEAGTDCSRWPNSCEKCDQACDDTIAAGDSRED